MPVALRLLAVAVALVLLPYAAAPAQAADPFYCVESRCHGTDARGDAPAQVDILSVAVTQSDKAFTMRLRVRRLPATGTLVFGAGVAGWGANFVVRKRKRGYSVRETTISEVEVYPPTRCRSASVRWNRRTDVVRARFPLRCTGSSGDTVVNGVDLRSGRAKDSIGQVFYGV